MSRLFLFLFLAALGFIGFKMGQGSLFSEKEPAPLTVHPQREFPLTEYRAFAFIVYASNQASWAERSLASIFAQNYEYYRVIFIDDASTDGTYETVQNYIVNNSQDERVILIRNETRLGPCASLYRAVQSCHDLEVAIPLEAKDWLSHEGVLTRLNAAFQNPDVWIADSQAISYPHYEMDQPGGLAAFYAALFKQVHLVDLFANGLPALSRSAYLEPLQSLAGGRVRIFSEPLSFVNQAAFSPEQKAIAGPAQLKSYKPLTHFPFSQSKEEKADIVVFSYDRPLQLYALLESIQRYISGYERCTVLYRASDERYAKGYAEAHSSFPSVRFVRQSSAPHKDFQPLLLQILADSPSPYILLAVDDLIVKDFVDLKMCAEEMDRTGAYGFYLRLGRNITHCYMMNSPQPLPPSLPLGNGIYAWDRKVGKFDWAFPNTLDMTLYRKADLKAPFEQMKYKHPNLLEHTWAQQFSDNPIGLYFESSKVVNLPLNIVNPSDCPHMNFMSPEEMLVKWNEGLKIDIDPLFRFENPSPHIEYPPELVPR